MIKKKQFVKDFKKDDMINDLFVVKFKKPVEQYKNGYKFELRLGDSSKEIMYKYWGPTDEAKVKTLYDSIKKEDIIHISGRVNEWNEQFEISANDQGTLQILKLGEYDIKDFIKISKKNPEEMMKEVMILVESVKNFELRKLLDYFFKNPEFVEKYKFCPAAMYIHHGWIHGLMEHSLAVAKTALNYQSIHPSMDRDLLITGALFHDMGKIEEFDVTTSIKVTTEGMLIGHVNIATEKLGKAMDELKTPRELRIKIIHMIMTHMGEYGSSKLPSFPEALTLFYSDQSDAKIMQMITLKEDAQTEDDYVYHRELGNIYLK